MTGRTKLFGTNVNFGARFDPYALDTTSTGQVIRVNESVFSQQKKLFRMTSANLSFGLNFGSETFKKKDKKDNTDPNETDEDPNNLPPDPLNDQGFDPRSALQGGNATFVEGDDGYAKFEIPWNISINYSFRLTEDRQKFDPKKMAYDYKITSDINLNGNLSLTPKWRINFASGYSFDRKEIAHTNVGISRDLHCWSMNFNLVPVGRYKSYFFTIRVNSSMLQDLKYEKRNHPRDNESFY
jgi:hypothetical protein